MLPPGGSSLALAHKEKPMAAQIVRLRSRPQKLREEVAEEARQLVLTLGMPETVTADILRAIERHVPADRPWSFVMLSPAQFVAVGRWVRQNSARPVQAIALWNELFGVLDGRTGEVLATRAELAELVGCHPNHVSGMMGELESVGAISRKREAGRVRYFLNPNVATSLAGRERDKAQGQAPELRLVTT